MFGKDGVSHLSGLRGDGPAIHEATVRLRATHSVTAVLALLVITLSLLAGCSRGQSQKAAVEALNKDLKHDTVELYLVIGRVSHKCAPIVGLVDNPDLTKVIEFQAAQKAGLITITPDGPGFWKVELVNPTPIVATALQKVRHNVEGGCDYIIFGLAVASKTVVDMVNLQEITGQTAEAEFTWKWVLAPAGVKLVDSLSEQERIQLSPHIERLRLFTPDPTFNLADMTAINASHQDKKTLKKSGDGWVVDQ